ncbi:MAG TPA: carbohydrate ABC transporter permease [Thermoleophilaceae bacterium]|nr:carbohydrate ABC transporter permease [Thermoleophilaceae bacterium]
MTARPPARRRAARVLARLSEHAFLTTVALICALPLYVMLIASLQRARDFDGSALLPSLPLTLDNYEGAWSDLGFDRMFVNSTVLSLASAAIATLLAAGAAYGFTRFRFAGRGVLLAAMVGMMAIPAIVVIVPLFVVMSDLGLVNRMSSAILAEAGLLLPFAIFLLYSYMRDLPRELFEAADVDGASRWRQFMEIALPLSRPALATTLVVSAIYAWNDLLIPLVLWQTEELTTLMVGLALLGPGRTGVQDVPLLMAGVVISIVPLVVAFVIARGGLIRGLTEGGER